MNWIKIEEKLPQDLENVLFTDKKHVYKGFTNCHFWGECNYWFSDTEHCIEDVTHWMPLPPLPKD